MNNEISHGNSGHGSYERRDIGIAAVLYFLVGLAACILLVYFLADGIYSFLSKRVESEQPPVSPLVTNAPADTRHLPTDYRDYLKQNFPSPQLEIDERTQIDGIRTEEADILSTYGWVDQKASIVRIPIDHAMDLIAQRGLPVRQEEAAVSTGINPKRRGTQQ